MDEFFCCPQKKEEVVEVEAEEKVKQRGEACPMMSEPFIQCPGPTGSPTEHYKCTGVKSHVEVKVMQVIFPCAVAGMATSFTVAHLTLKTYFCPFNEVINYIYIQFIHNFF